MFAALRGVDGTPREALVAVAREFSPRIEVPSVAQGERGGEVTLDLSGVARLFGDARTIGAALQRTAADHGLRMGVAIAGTRTAARLLALAGHASADQQGRRRTCTVIEPGREAAALAPLPLALLAHVAGGTGVDEAGPDVLQAWGLRTLGDLARLPADGVAARLGQEGVRWQRLARGEDLQPLVPAALEERFEQALDLEWPIEGLEPLSFVLGRLLEPLSAHLERRGRGAAVLHVRLHLVKRDGVTREIHARALELPAPMRDARTLRTLALLDLESHPPAAAVDRVVVAVDPTPARVLQFSLLARPLPSPDQISTLMARLTALMGDGRCGSPVAVDSWRPGAFAMKPFAPRDAIHDGPRRHSDPEKTPNDLCASASPRPIVAVRRFRLPVPVRVRAVNGEPSHVTIDRHGLSGGRVESCAGPWRTSGAWWADHAHGSQRRGDTGELPKQAGASVSLWPTQWDRDEWDVAVAGGPTYRMFRDRRTGGWFLDGLVD